MTAAIEGFASGAVEANGVTLAYRLGGDPDGPPVVLWHGFLGTSFTWRKVAPLLAARGWSRTCAATATATSRKAQTATTAPTSRRITARSCGGHFIPEERPDELAALVMDLMSRGAAR